MTPDDCESAGANEDELARIRRVYADYDGNTATRNRWSGQNAGNAANRRARRQAFADTLTGAFEDPSKLEFLEIGCGGGAILQDLLDVGVHDAHLMGIDLLVPRLVDAARSVPHVRLAQASGTQLPFASESFDVVVMATVLSSLHDPSVLRSVCSEAWRVTRTGGGVLNYDLRMPNPMNRQVRPIKRSEMRRWFPTAKLTSSTLTVNPLLIRRVEPRWPGAHAKLARIPLLRTHRLTLAHKS